MIKEEILKLVKSKDLIDKINEIKFDFCDFDLLVMAYKFAPSYDERLRLLEKIANESSDSKTVERAKEIIEYEKSIFKDFITAQDNEVYEALIKESPHSYEERYLAKTYKGALNKINLFYDYYSDIGGQETEKSRYKILKRKVYDTINAEDFEEDIIAECTFISKSVLYDVTLYNYNDVDTRVFSLYDHIVQYPKFLNDGDLVSYIDYDLNKVYGVVTYSGPDDNAACIVNLDNEYVNSKTVYQKDENGYYPVFISHTHIEYPLVFKENIDEVPEEVKNKHNYFLEFWKKINNEN